MAAHDFNASHSEREVFFLFDLGIRQFAEEARPTAAAFIFHGRLKERGITADAVVDARIFFVPEDPGERPFGRCLPGDLELHRVEVVTPFFFGDVLPVFHVLPWVGLLRSI